MRPMMEGLIVDNFAGGGGASDGIAAAFGRPVDIAINHDPEAIAMHMANHPETVHICQSVWKADPLEVVQGRRVALGWFSPDCKHFSKAKGGKPVEKGIRDLAWVVVHWVRRLGTAFQPRVIMLENVEEFRTWCPIDPVSGLPIKHRRADGQMSLLEDPPVLKKGKRKLIKPEGETFQLWVAALKKAGYTIEWRELRGCDYGAPTIRKRLFVIARCDGRPIVWPEPTHGPGRAKPWRTAAEIIDWSLDCPSIFGRKKPLAENTLRRIAHGVMKFVVNAAQPFIVPVTNSNWAANRTIAIDKGLPTITTAKGGEMALVSPTLVQTGYGERKGQAPRVPGLHKPLGTPVAGGGKAALVAAFLAKHTSGGIGSTATNPAPTVTANGFQNPKRQGGATPLGIVCAHLAQFSETRPGRVPNSGHPADEPTSTIVQRGPLQAVVQTHLVPHMQVMRNAECPFSAADRPTQTVTAGGAGMYMVAAFLAKYFGAAKHGQPADEALHTVSTKPRFGLVTVTIAGEEYVIVDIGMRMLTPRELARAQGFNDNYILDPVCDRILPSGKRKRGRLPIASQIRMIGNSVNRDVAEALVAANCNAPIEDEIERRAA